MLRITESESTQAAKSYFGRSLSRGDYYLEGQEVAGCWGGRAAIDLGLGGPVDREAFVKLLENKRPHGDRLTARTSTNRRPGYDFTFDVPKSVSLAHMVGGDERITEAMRRAAMETMAEIEEEMHARVRKKGAFEDRRTGRMVWADFTHFTSRPTPLPTDVERAVLKANPWLARFRDKAGVLNLPDPHLHMHVYAINATYDEVEKLWKAGEFMRIKRDASYYQAAYHTRLAGELQKLGYTIEPTAKAFELAGVPRSVVDVFSRRTKEVEAAAKALGIDDPDAKGALGAKTRLRKNTNLRMDQLRAAWKPFLERKEVRNLEGVAKSATKVRRAVARDEPDAAFVGVSSALVHELERVSEVSERRLLATALERSVGRAGVASVHAALRSTPNVVEATIEGERRLTTLEVLGEESALMRLVRESRGTVPAVATGEYRFRNPLFQTQTKETEEQRDAVRLVLQSQDWIVGVIGRAGTGKTTLLKEVDEGVRGAGCRLFVCAPTAEAARGVLRGEGFSNAETVKRLLVDEGLQATLKDSVLWIDEAGMLGNRDTLAVLRLAKAKGVARVVLSGDPTQIRSVPRGDAFRFLEEQAGLKIARLENIRRQKSPELKAAVEAISRGEIDRGFEMLDRDGAIREMDGKDPYRELAKAYVGKTAERGRRGRAKTVLVVSPTHREGEAVTQTIRDELRHAGRIGAQDITIPRTVNLSWTEPEKGNAAAYEHGMIVQFKQHAKGFRKSERVRVEQVDGRKGKVMVRRNDRTITELPLSAAKQFQVYRQVDLKVAPGDRLRITENAQEGPWRVDNGTIIEVAGLTPEGGIETTAGAVLPRHFGHLTHGYVFTADSAQAKTVDAVYAAIGRDSMGATDLRRFYVTVSRAREDAVIFTNDRAALLSATRRDTERRFATELVGVDRSRMLLRHIQHRESERLLELARERNRNEERKRSIERASLGIEVSRG